MKKELDLIAVFIPSLRGGGAERVMLTLAEGFLQKGLRVDLLLAQKEGSFLEKVPPGITVVDLHAPRVRYAIGSLTTYLRQNCPDVLLSTMDHANVIALLARKFARVPTPVIATVHTTMSAAMKGLPRWRGRLRGHILRHAYRLADAVVAVSQGVADDMAKMTGFPRERIEVIYNPVVTSELGVKAAEPLDHPWFKRGEPPVLLSVGRLTKPKDYGLLIRALKKVRQSRDVRLILLGEGEERPSLEKLIRELDLQDQVSMPGFVPNPYPYMKQASLFVLSSCREGLPTVLIEALAMGVPVIATDCPSGPFEILKGGRLGTLVPVGDVSALAAAILGVLEGKVRHCPDRDLGRFEREQAVQSYLDLFKGAGHRKSKVG